MQHSRAVIALLLAAICYASFGVLIRALDPAFTPLGQIVARFVTATALLGGIALATRTQVIVPRAERKLILIFSFVFTGMIVAITYAVLYMKATNALYILYAVSLALSLIIGALRFGERVTLPKGMGTLLCLIGIGLFIDWQAEGQALLGIILAIVAGIFEVLTNATRKQLQGSHMTTALLYQVVLGTVVCGAIALATKDAFIKPDVAIPWMPLLIFSVAMIVGSYLLNYGFGHCDLNIATVIFASELAFALAMNIYFLHEWPTYWEWIGAVAILVALPVAQLPKQ